MAPTSRTTPAATVTAPKFDPRALLNPKAAAKRAKEPSKPVTTAFSMSGDLSPSTDTISNGTSQNSGMASMIENLHNVERRDERPAKKQKKEHIPDGDDDLVEVKQNGIVKGDRHGGTGELGAYIKEKRKEGMEEQGPDFIDLTEVAEGEDSDVQVISDTMSKEVCLGRIENARVNAYKVPTPKPGGAFAAMKSHWPPMSVKLARRPGNNAIIAATDPMGHDFGNIDQRTALAITPMLSGSNINGLRLQGRLESRTKKAFDYPGQQVSDSYSLSLNLYAPRKFAVGIGKFLSQKGIWLRDPIAVDRGCDVFNPHAPKSLAPAPKTALPRSTREVNMISRTHEETRNDVLKIFDQLKTADSLPQAVQPSNIITPLLAHQGQALYFMRKRERLPVTIVPGTGEDTDDVADDTTSLWKKSIAADGRVSYINVITSHKMRSQPKPALGGIIADVMGLGKTLNVLSLVASTSDEAKAFSRDQPPEARYEGDPELVLNSRATLVVCPLSTLVNWEDQIKSHVSSDKKLTYYIYQGANRTNDPTKLRNYDIVLTTYGAVGGELNKRGRSRPNSPLMEVNWFRIVLDEAHTIRKTSTQQSQACCALSSDRRWCITGTPVQNRLDDLGALIKFLKIKPFDETGMFASYIATPLRTGNSEAIPRLRVLVDTITLRRLKDKLDLPERKELVVRLKMSDIEKNLYDQFSKDASSKIQAITGGNKMSGKAYAHVLKAIGRLRMLAVHGSEMLSDEDWELAKGFDASNAIDLEDEDDTRPDRTPSQAFEMYRIMKDSNVNFCAKCQRWLNLSDEDSESEEDSVQEDDEDFVVGYLMPCNQLICPKCITGLRKEMTKKAGPDNYTDCPICDNWIRVTFFELKRNDILNDTAAQEIIRRSKFAKNLARYTGPSTKVQALMEDLHKDQAWSDDHQDERPIKSVVFSEWTSHLDLIQHALTFAGIETTRLDGSMTFSARTQAINNFQTSPKVNVILVSLKAGGLGLNLTAACRVYTMEPNYNPAAEAQAVERVHRLGQTREVIIKRFIMQDTIEEKVLKLQAKKLALAEFSIERDSMKKLSKEEAAKAKLDDLKQLLR